MIRKITFLLTIGFVCFGLSLASQAPTFSLSPATSTLDIGDTLVVEIKAEDLNNLLGFSFTLQWETDVLAFDNTTIVGDTIEFISLSPFSSFGYGDNFASDTPKGSLTFVWSSPIPLISFPDTTIGMIIKFTAIGAGTATLDLNGNKIPAEYFQPGSPPTVGTPDLNDAIITVNGGVNPPGFTCNFPGFGLAIEPDSAATGEQICLPIHNCNWTDIISAQWSMDYNPSILQFDSISNINLPQTSSGLFNANNTDGWLIFSWIDSVGSGVTFPDSTIFDLCFTAIGAGGALDTLDFRDSPLPVDIVDVNSNGMHIGYDSQPGFINVSGSEPSAATVVASTETAMPGELVCNAITVQNFSNILGFEYTLDFDTALLTYNTFMDVNPNVPNLAGAFNDSPGFTNNGKFLTVWASGTPINLMNGDTLYRVCFDVKNTAIPGSSAFVTLGGDDPISRTASQDDGMGGDMPITLLSNDGAVNIVGAGQFEMMFPNIDVCTDSTFCIPFTVVDGFNSVQSIQYTHHWDSDLLTFTGLNNVNSAIPTGIGDFLFFENPPGTLRIFWQNQSNVILTIPPGGVLYEMCFTHDGEDAEFSTLRTDGDPVPIEVVDENGQQFVPTVTDSDFNTGTITILDSVCPMNQAVSATPTIMHVACFGESTGSINLEVSGGDGAGTYTYIWAPDGEVTEDIMGKPVGDYSVTITSGATSFMETYSINEPTAALSVSEGSTGLDCNGDIDGTVTLTIVGGTIGTGYTYNWNSGETTKDLTGKGPGTYICTITDANSCTVISTPITFSEPTALNIEITNEIDVLCNGESTGEIDITVTGGTPDINGAYTYIWTGGATTEDLVGIGVGNYTVTVTDNNTCSSVSTTVQINEPPTAISISATDVTDASCGDPVSGAIDITVTGGTPGLSGYTFIWNNGATTEDLDPASSGTVYIVTITDENSCTHVGSPITVGNTDGVTISVDDETNPSCTGVSDGSITIIATGGSGTGYIYNWSNGVSGSPTISSLAAGGYFVTVTDSDNCAQISNEIILTATSSIGIMGTTSDASCGGADNGGVDITVTGANGTPLYLWSNAAVTEDLVGVTNGSYTVTITDGIGCTEEETFTVGAGSGFTVNNDGITDSSCNGATDGAVNITLTGASGTPTYIWSTGASTQNISNVTNGSYTVTVTDGAGCEETASYTVGAGTGFTVNNDGITDASCGGATDGAVSITLTGANGTPTYIWSTGASTQNINNVTNGSYTVTVTDGVGCEEIASYTVGTGSGISVGNESVINVSCFGDSDGEISLPNPTGGSGNYSYSWTGGLTGQNPTGVAQGVYDVTVTDDDNGCIVEIDNISVTEPNQLEVVSNSLVVQDVSCADLTDGTISLSIAGGTPNNNGDYNFSWTGPNNFTASNEDITDLAGGIYNVTISDVNNCSITISTISVGVPSPIQIAGSVTNEVNGSDGAIDITPTDGTGVFTGYSWTGPNGFAAGTQDIAAVVSGTYNVTVTDSNNCTETASFVVNAANVPGPIALLITPATCFGASDGAINLDVQGGFTPYGFSWDGPNGFTDITQNINGLVAGTYDVTVTGNDGAMGLGSFVVPEPNIVNYTLDNSTDALCNGDANGTIGTTPSGGSGSGYSYDWGSGFTGEDPTGLPAGIYTPTITDSNGCIGIGAAVTISQPDVLSIILVNAVNPSCSNSTDGSIDIEVSGGTTTYSYNWTLNGNSYDTTEDISNLSAGIYCLTVTDFRGCTAELCPIELVPPNPIVITIDSTTNLLCAGEAIGAIYITVTGGDGNYQYDWKNNGTSFGFIQDDLVGALGGNYSVCVTDGNGCSETTPNIMLSEPAPLTLMVDIMPGSMAGNDGGIQTTVSGGTPDINGNYNYTWSGPGSNYPNVSGLTGLPSGIYGVTATDDNGCTISEQSIILEGTITVQPILTNPSCADTEDGSIELIPINTVNPSYIWSGPNTIQGGNPQISLGAGTYCVTMTDDNGVVTDCFDLIAPTPMVVTGDAINISGNVNSTGVFVCDGSVNINIVGGTQPLSYLWNNGETSEDLFDVCKDAYSVQITDGNNCIVNSEEWIVGPANMQFANTPTTTDVNCNGGSDGSVSLEMFGGCAPYSFELSNGETFIASEANGQALFDNLSAGSYSVTVSDGDLNSPQQTDYTFSIGEPTAVTIAPPTINPNTDPTGLNCNGSVNITPSGGAGSPYTFLWSNGETSEDVTNLCNDIYSVVVTDANGCTEELTGIEVELGLTLTIEIEDEVCFGEGGSANTTVTGGATPISFLWNDGITFANRNNLLPGNYSVTATDALGNSTDQSFTINGPSGAIDLTTTITEPTGTTPNGAIGLTPSGGWGGFTYEWNGPNGFTASTQDIGSLEAGCYSLLIRDAGGCTYMDELCIGGPAFAVSIQSGSDACQPFQNQGILEAFPNNGSEPYNYLWSNGANTQIIGGLAPGAYTVTITDDNGATIEGSIDLEDIVAMSVRLEVDDVSGNVTSTVSGGLAPYTYLWNNSTNDTTADIVDQPSGLYGLLVTDANGCTTIGEAEVSKGPCELVRRVITPNNDLKNDEFIIACANRFALNLQIFNRWGQLVYQSLDYQNDWIGTDQGGNPLPEDGYFYVIEYSDGDGTQQIKGHVTIVR